MNDLTERWKAVECVTGEETVTIPYELAAATLAALTPVTDEEVKKALQKLPTVQQLQEYESIAELIEQAGIEWVDTCLDDLFDEYAICLYLIERLARELKRTSIAYDLAREERDKAEQRIEELKNEKIPLYETTKLTERVELAERQRDEYEKLLKKIAGELHPSQMSMAINSEAARIREMKS